MAEQQTIDVPRPGPSPRGAGAPQARRPGLVVAICLAVAAVSAGGVWLLWRVFVGTTHGQVVDQTALYGARYGQTRLWHVADKVLSIVSVGFIASVLLAAILVALLRRRWLLAVQVAVLMAGANLTTQVLKYEVFDRPAILTSVHSANTLPSGHTTAAASVSAAALLVVPPRARPWTAAIGALYTTATGVSTLIGQWHRPSDVVAATLVVLAWMALTCALVVLAPGRPSLLTGAVEAGAVRRASRGPVRSGGRVQRWVLAALVVVGAAAGGVAVVALGSTWTHVGVRGRADLLVAYGGGAAAALMACCLTSAVMLALRAAASSGLPRA